METTMIDNSSNRTIDVFFYGLYMDPVLLEQKGVMPRNPRSARVDGYALRIGQRVTLLRSLENRAFGMVYSLTHAEINSLYWGAGIEVYRAEAVIAQIVGGGTVPALCCILLDPPAADEINAEYSEKLRTVLKRLELPTIGI
jgi:hypothetical protein